jgi:hypothetical protein
MTLVVAEVQSKTNCSFVKALASVILINVEENVTFLGLF